MTPKFFCHDDVGKGMGGGLYYGGVMGDMSKGAGGSHIAGGSGGGPGNWRYRKLEMPLFDGDDPDKWILRVER